MTRNAGSCAAFRALLEEKLAGAGAPSQRVEERLGTLSWHAHLLACESCRELLAAEQALEILLATLPEPRLSRELAERVLLRLRAGRVVEAELDALLDLDSAPRAPERLAPRILARLAHERALGERAATPAREPASATDERRLDVLLDAACDVDVPAGIARRILVALRPERASAHAREASERASARVGEASERASARVGEAAERASARAREAREHAPARRREAPAPVRRTRSFALVALAAAVTVALGLAWWVNRPQGRDDERAPIVDRGAIEERGRPHEPVEERIAPQFVRPAVDVAELGPSSAPDAQMLEALNVLEQWDLLMQSDVDVLLSTLDATEPVLLEFESETVPLEPDTKEAAPPSKG